MFDELTKDDLKKMQEEVDYRTCVLRPKLIEDVKTARAFGDLSENFEYKAAKLEKNRNDSRIRYLERMIKTAVVISDSSREDEVGIGDKVTVHIIEDDENETYQIVTSVRQNVLEGIINKDSPMGKALMRRKVGDKVTVRVSADYSYEVTVKAIEKSSADSVPMAKY